jgi:ABC-type nitrate/sulfonate/bicarbonate transport system permease component
MKGGRALLALGLLAFLYGVAAEVLAPYLPRRIWLATHYIEDVELLPTYRSLLEEVVFLLRSGILPASVAASASRVLAGLLLGAAVGVPVGLAMGRSQRLEALLDPWVTLFRFTPALALLPLYVGWFGLGEASRILLIATAVAVVTLLGAFQGARQVPRVYLEAARALGASPALTWRRVVLPAALPQIAAGVRIALGLAWLTVVAAELIAPRMPSLGYLLALAGAYPRVPTIVAGLAAMGAVVLLSDAVALALYGRATWWMRRRDGRTAAEA